MRRIKYLLLALLAASGCYLKSFPVTPRVVEGSTYKIIANGYQGTAWVVSPGYLATAGHMCEASQGEPTIIVGQNGRKVLADEIAWEMSTDTHADVCIMKARGHVGEPLVLADHQPEPGTVDGYVGYPDGIYTVGTGKYQEDIGSSAPCDHGASGSAMFTSEGVYGILVQGRPGEGELIATGKYGCRATPVSELISLLKENGIPYTTTPDEPPPGVDHNQLGD